MKFTILFLTLIFICSFAQNLPGTVYFQNNQWSFKSGIDTNGVAYGNLENTINTTGWGVLRIQSNSNYEDLQQMYGSGYLECSLTAPNIWEMYLNMNDYFFKQPPSQKILNFFDAQEAWVRKNIAGNFSSLTNYWKQVAMIMAQFDGCVQGFADVSKNNQSTSLWVVRLLNGVGDLLDLINAVDESARPDFDKMSKSEMLNYVAKNGHCSGFIKLTGDFSQLFAGHSSWFVFAATNRIYKHYFFNVNSNFVAAKKMSFSSYPGFLESLDDFYMLGSGLVMIQTTNSIFNFTLYDAVKPESLFAWQRVRLANHMARNGEEWSTLVSQYNSGTYNNQYMVIDYNLYKPGQQIPDGLLWVVEQIPGLMRYADQTELLRFGGFWSSYNVPFYTDIYNLSGYPAMVKKYGDCMSYQLAPRARIFRRDQDKAVDYESFKAILRYNDYKNDPYSEGNPMWAICSRGDLQAEGASPFGCYDTKATSYDRVPYLISEAINGPTTSGGVLPPFSWNQYPTHYHFGEPTLYNFSFVEMNPKWN